MRIFKTRIFTKWARKVHLSDGLLNQAVMEMERGLIDANLGGGVYKKRIALSGRGKRSGARSIIAYKMGKKAFFIFGFAKNEKENLTAEELEIVKVFASESLNYSDEQLHKLIKDSELIEVSYEKEIQIN